jgi:cysteine desulfuration protein SufE
MSVIENLTFSELKENLSYLEDWEERYSYILDLGRRLPLFPAELKTPDHKVTGCLSQVWVAETPQSNAQNLEFIGDSDSVLVRGLVAIAFILFSGKPAQEIIQADYKEAFRELGLSEHISGQRSNGFFSLIKKIQGMAEKYFPVGSIQ